MKVKVALNVPNAAFPAIAQKQWNRSAAYLGFPAPGRNVSLGAPV